jgi:dTDP-4-amino-4,6-dideoxygalactose transaminase
LGKLLLFFVDIHPDYLTIDETKIEAAITDKTTAILATHVLEIRVMLRLLKQFKKQPKSDL